MERTRIARWTGAEEVGGDEREAGIRMACTVATVTAFALSSRRNSRQRSLKRLQILRLFKLERRLEHRLILIHDQIL
jgi:hypothetical protein